MTFIQTPCCNDMIVDSEVQKHSYHVSFYALCVSSFSPFSLNHLLSEEHVITGSSSGGK